MEKSTFWVSSADTKYSRPVLGSYSNLHSVIKSIFKNMMEILSPDSEFESISNY